jgi:hypothetical protein
LLEVAVCRQETRVPERESRKIVAWSAALVIGQKPAWGLLPESATIRQLHWHRHFDVKRPYRRCAGSHGPEVVMIEAVVLIKAD